MSSQADTPTLVGENDPILKQLRAYVAKMRARMDPWSPEENARVQLCEVEIDRITRRFYLDGRTTTL